MRSIEILEVASEYGAGTRGASLGVDAIRLASLNLGYDTFTRFPEKRISGNQEYLFRTANFSTAKRILPIIDIYEDIAASVMEILGRKHFPLVISGDHSNAGGTIAGLTKAYPDKCIGVIWIDAHGDLHTPYSSVSGNIHGMPVAAALGLDNKHLAVNDPKPEVDELWEKICSIGGKKEKIQPEDLVFIGIRDLEEQEWAVIHEEKILYFDNHAVNSMGTGAVLEQTYSHLSHCDMIYVSFDIDSLDAEMVPGTGTPVPDGLTRGQARQLLEGFWKSDKLVCMEFTEVNPILDHANQTARIAAELLYEVINS